MRPGEDRRQVTASIVLRPIRTGAPTAVEIVGFAILNVMLPLTCTVLGFWVAAARVTDRRAWLLLVLVLSLAEFGGGYFRSLYGREDVFQPVAAAYQPLLANMWPTAMLLFAISFPERLALDRKVPWLKWVVIAPIVLRVVALNPIYDFIARRDPDAARRLHQALAPTETYFGTSYGLFILLFLVIMGYRTITERQPDARRRLRLLVTGAALSVTPMLAFLLLVAAGRRSFADWVVIPVLGSLLLFPLTMAYVIVVHRAMDVRVVVRQGLRYLLARGSLRGLQFVVSSATLAAAIALGARSASLISQVLLIGAGVGAVVLIRRFADTLRDRVDRRFFREAYDADQILSDLASEVRTMIETRPLLETVTRRIGEALHVPRVAILLNEGGTLAVAHAIGFDERPEVRMPASGVTASRLQREPHVAGAARRARVVGADGWRRRARRAGAAARGAAAAAVAQPETGRRDEPRAQAFGGTVLGHRSAAAGIGRHADRPRAREQPSHRSGRPRDRRAREAPARARDRARGAGAALSAGLSAGAGSRVRRRLPSGARDRRRLLRLRAARRRPPRHRDRRHLRQGHSSGAAHGDPACVPPRADRARTRRISAGLMADLNGLVYESSAPNRYATFFYAEYDPVNRRLAYVNAGHNPPIVLRGDPAAAPDLVHLDAGGPVIGLIPGCDYAQGEVQLAVGDLLVAFTDGVSEAMDAAQEEWGEARLVPLVRAARREPPATLITRIMAGADAFVNGAPQHDDMTLVVMRCVVSRRTTIAWADPAVATNL